MSDVTQEVKLARAAVLDLMAQVAAWSALNEGLDDDGLADKALEILSELDTDLYQILEAQQDKQEDAGDNR